MTDSPNTVNQQAQTPEEVRQQLLAHLDASKEVVGELTDKELEAVSGGGMGGIMGSIMSGVTGLMGGGAGAGGGTGTGSSAANQHSNTIISDNHSAASSSIGSFNLGNKIRK